MSLREELPLTVRLPETYNPGTGSTHPGFSYDNSDSANEGSGPVSPREGPVFLDGAGSIPVASSETPLQGPRGLP